MMFASSPLQMAASFMPPTQRRILEASIIHRRHDRRLDSLKNRKYQLRLRPPPLWRNLKCSSQRESSELKPIEYEFERSSSQT